MKVKSKKPRYKLMRVEWEDSSQPISPWQWVDDYKLPEVVNCISVGFLIANTKQAVALAPNLGNTHTDSVQASGIIRIPKTAIRVMDEL